MGVAFEWVSSRKSQKVAYKWGAAAYNEELLKKCGGVEPSWVQQEIDITLAAYPLFFERNLRATYTRSLIAKVPRKNPRGRGGTVNRSDQHFAPPTLPPQNSNAPG